MRELIVNKLQQVKSLDERKELKNTLNDFFEEIIKHQKIMNQRLEARIFDEYQDLEKNYDIYTTIMKKDEFDPLNDFFHPICLNDLDKTGAITEDITKEIFYNKELLIKTIFLELDDQQIEKLNLKTRNFSGKIITADKEFDVKFQLKRSKCYFDTVEKLNKSFEDNLIPWRTLNFPFLNKFFDIIIVKYSNELRELSLKCEYLENFPSIIEVRYDLEEIEEYKYLDIIPVWNIETIEHKSDGFPIPAEDKINFEHTISMKKLNKNYGYLVTSENSNIFEVRRDEFNLVITTDRNRSIFWNILKIIQDERIANIRNEYPIYSNAKKRNFLNKFSHKQNSIIRTHGEIYRIANSFEDGEEFLLKNIEIKNNLNGEMITTYDLNHFIKDEIREANEKKLMILTFQCKSFNYLSYDILSFLVSEIQMYFPEYICKGVLL